MGCHVQPVDCDLGGPMGLDRLSNGERIAGVSAILLFAFMFFDWFGMESSEDSFNLFSVSRSAWEALDYIPIVLLIAITVTLYEIGLRVVLKHRAPTNAVVAILGTISAVLILYRVVFPPTFGSEESAWGTVTYEGTLQVPIFLALAAAVGIAYGGLRAMREEAPSSSRPQDK
jgi:uncharacterized membrane protein